MAADRFLTRTLSWQAQCENYTKVNPAIPGDTTAPGGAMTLAMRAREFDRALAVVEHVA